jgi:hypothetical protein
MAKNKITEYSTTAGSNTDVGNIQIEGSDDVANFDNALRELMKHIADLNTGASFIHDTYKIADSDDETKLAKFDAGSITEGQTRTFTFPDVSGTFALISDVSGTYALNSSVSFIDSADDGSKNTALNMPSGTTAQRPSTPDGVQMRYNSTLSIWEGYNGTQWGDLVPNSDRVVTYVNTASTYAASTDRQLTEFDTTITTVGTNSKVRIEVRISYERTEDGVFYLKRDGVEIGSASGAGSRSAGITPCAYDTNTASTMASSLITFEDTVTSAGSYEYTLHVRGSNAEFNLNRTTLDLNASAYERATSEIVLTEILV